MSTWSCTTVNRSSRAKPSSTRRCLGAVTAGFDPWTNSTRIPGSSVPRWFMFTLRRPPAGAPSSAKSSAPPRLAITPPPSTPSWPVKTGSPRTARYDAPPLRFRSSPHPMRRNAGWIEASSSANATTSSASTPVTSAVRDGVHSAAPAMSSSAPDACASTTARSMRPSRSRWRTMPSTSATSVPGRSAR